MERIERFSDLAGLLSAQLKKGVVTNNFLSRQDYDREIEAGLSVHAFDGGLLLFRRRTDHFILNFYLQPGGAFVLPPLELPAVTELVWRPKDADATASATRRLQAAGFRERFRRRRYARPAAPGLGAESAHRPGPERADVLLDFLEDHFDHLAGCIPTAEAMREILHNREVFCTEDAAGVTGLLHFARGRTSTEIRHLAVRPDCRSQGLAGTLLGAYLQETDGQKSLVWARQGNAPAERFYEKYQYRPDGWESAVLLAGGKDDQ